MLLAPSSWKGNLSQVWSEHWRRALGSILLLSLSETLSALQVSAVTEVPCVSGVEGTSSGQGRGLSGLGVCRDSRGGMRCLHACRSPVSASLLPGSLPSTSPGTIAAEAPARQGFLGKCQLAVSWGFQDPQAGTQAFALFPLPRSHDVGSWTHSPPPQKPLQPPET